ncbi:Protein of unknown function [Gryllus bimaculatus]|nr:Protein of unknown function [Gryllus bimaculatus]
MEEINVLTESLIKIEDVKEEPADTKEHCWNTFEEFEPPIAVSLEDPPVKQETACSDEEKEPHSSWRDSVCGAEIKQDTTSCSPGVTQFNTSLLLLTVSLNGKYQKKSRKLYWEHKHIKGCKIC